MTSYNIAVTVSPNIFRPQQLIDRDMTNMGTFYDIFIKMIDYYDQTFLFVDGPTTATNDED